VGCSCGTSYFYITPYGDMTSCDFNHRSFGNVLEEPLYQVWEKMTHHAAYKEAKWGGCKVKDSAFLNERIRTLIPGNGESAMPTSWGAARRTRRRC